MSTCESTRIITLIAYQSATAACLRSKECCDVFQLYFYLLTIVLTIISSGTKFSPIAVSVQCIVWMYASNTFHQIVSDIIMHRI